MEAGVIISTSGEPLYWHLPNTRTIVSLPDSRKLWEVFWNNKDIIAGFAHSHPGTGTPGPSHTDLTTFSAIELALGNRYDWWITSINKFIVVRWEGPDKLNYTTAQLDFEPFWLKQLRNFSIEEEVYNDRYEYYSGQ